ncbi:MAG: hypothetical protein ACK4YU_12395, partial [Paracoccus sp. (in: a-proteobacteria)]
ATPRSGRPHATVMLGRYQSAQGPVIGEHGDGSVTIDAGGRILTGMPLGQRSGRAPSGRPLWAI